MVRLMPVDLFSLIGATVSILLTVVGGFWRLIGRQDEMHRENRRLIEQSLSSGLSDIRERLTRLESALISRGRWYGGGAEIDRSR